MLYLNKGNDNMNKIFKAEITKVEMDQLEKLLEKTGLTKEQFLRYCIMKFVGENKDKF